MVLIYFIVYSIWFASCGAKACLGSITVATVDVGRSVAVLDPRFVSVGLEMYSFLSTETVLSNTTFQKAASALAPAFLRIGGITGDWTNYTFPYGKARKSQSRRTRARQYGNYWPYSDREFRDSDLDTLLNFTESTGLDLLFDVNELYGRTCAGPDN